MSEKHKRQLSSWERAEVFEGVPVAVFALLYTIFDDGHGSLVGVSDKVLPYLLMCVMLGGVFVSIAVFDRLPKEMPVPLGIAGWILAAVILCWYFWFGRGAH